MVTVKIIYGGKEAQLSGDIAVTTVARKNGNTLEAVTGVQGVAPLKDGKLLARSCIEVAEKIGENKLQVGSMLLAIAQELERYVSEIK